MKILWVKTDFLHPTTRGGQIRSLEILRRLHRRHQIHYIAYDNPASPEGLARAGEYSTHAYPLKFAVPPRGSLAFARQMAENLFSPLPLPVGRYRSAKMRRQIQTVIDSVRPDSMVCDFLFPAPNLPDPAACVLFQHNVESIIWERQVEQAGDPLRRAYFGLQARRMLDYEGETCRRCGHVIAVSQVDADRMRERYGAQRISVIPTGVDLEYFAPPPQPEAKAELVFVGSMDWMPNIDGVNYFLDEVFPRIIAQRPATTFAIVGRSPSSALRERAASDPRITVTGTVPDVRPWLWGARVSVVPLRIGGGTRLKIYEAMAARVPVVSTTIGAEGLTIDPPRNIRLADGAEQIAAACLAWLDAEDERHRVAAAAWEMVARSFSWEHVACCFEEILAHGPRACSP
jgi:glycosyltransferase involved in cell wall biosynthesis